MHRRQHAQQQAPLAGLAGAHRHARAGRGDREQVGQQRQARRAAQRLGGEHGAQRGQSEGRGDQMRAAHALGMTTEGPRAVIAVAEVLARHGRERVPRHVITGHLGPADQACPRAQEARGHLGILVDRPALVPAAGPQQPLAPPDPPEHAGVELALRTTVAVRAPLARTAAPEPRRQRRGHGPRDRPDRAGNRRPADPLRVAAPQSLDAGGEVAIGVISVSVHARDELAPRLPEAHVEPAGRSLAGVVEHPDTRVARRELEQNLARGVLRAAVREEQLDQAVEALGLHRGDRLANMALLVADRDEYADIRVAAGPRRGQLSSHGARAHPPRIMLS